MLAVRLSPPAASQEGDTMTITLQAVLIAILIGAVAGWLAGQIVRGSGFGLIGDIIVGIIGALIAGVLFPTVGVTLTSNSILAAIIWSTLGAIILLLVLRLFRRA